jgi:pyruvate-formate lyase-activating enzyme
MANVVLVSFAGYPYTPSSLCPDNGLGILAAVLREAGHAPLILDFGTLETMRRLFPEELSAQVAPLLAELMQHPGAPDPKLLARLAQANAELESHQAREIEAIGDELSAIVADVDPACVCFKLWNGDGLSGSVTIAEILRRRHPHVKLYAGGPHATWFGHRIFVYTQAFDAIAVGEGESTILRLVDHATRGTSLDGVPGLIRSVDERTTAPCETALDDLPLALYDTDVYPAMAGDQKLKMIVLDESRGCPFDCAFCTHPIESGRRLRTRSAKRIVDDMEAIITRHGIHAFRFAGSSTPGSLMAEVADQILARDLKVQYASFAHFASARPEHFEIMRKSGLHAMFFGLETGSEDLLRRVAGKASKLHNIRETVEAAKAAGVAVVCSMIVPMPFETEETFQESLDLLLALRPDSVPVQFPGLLPGTRWFESPEQYGFEVDREAYLAQNLAYKIKLLFPPTFWEPLPYSIHNGAGEKLGFAEMIRQTGRFVAALEANGILTGVPDDNLLMAHLVGMSPRQFRDAARLWCATGDAEALGRFVCAVNHASAS